MGAWFTGIVSLSHGADAGNGEGRIACGAPEADVFSPITKGYGGLLVVLPIGVVDYATYEKEARDDEHDA
jgi:hypothetical protein